jgi:gamma-glutamylcyclotransferase (GGCT)/AIG2-like uncharacterized protein YtfP
MNAARQIFVYGSLRSGFHHPAYEYISRYFVLIGNAKVKGSLYDMGEYPAAVPSNGNDCIVGELYAIKQADEFGWAIAQLDDYEGIHAEQGEIALYKREQTTVYINDTETLAWIYWFNGDVSSGTPIESGDVLQFIEQKNK